MKKLAFYCLYFSVVYYATAQTLYSDDQGVSVFYEIKKTNKSTSCNSNTRFSLNFSDKKILIWKVVIGIENKHTHTIVPRGVGIANINVSPQPLKPYSVDYCNYKKIENYEPSKGYLDQSLFGWPIKEFVVDEIEPGVTITNTAYIYLYEGQTPIVSNSEFLGYRLKKDFMPNDTLITEQKKKNPVKVESSKQSYHTADSINENKDSMTSYSKQKDTAVQLKPQTPLTLANLNIRKEKPNIIPIEMESSVKENNSKRRASKKVESAITKNNITENLEPTRKQRCPSEKAKEYKNKVASDPLEQRAYSWLAIYFTYKCECENGSNRPDSLVAIINNVVDSYTTNTNDAYGKISKVSKCEKANQ